MPPANILIVEDDPTISIDIQLNLSEGGYAISGAVHSGEAALSVLEKGKVDLAMIDINLAGEMNGIELAAIIDRQYAIPFIYLTSYADNDTLEQAAKTFPSSYLVKPYKESDLVPAVKMALFRYQAKNESRIPHLELINKNTLSRITNTEYNIIQAIWKGMSSQEIVDTFYISKNTLKTHVRNIYSKLEVHSKTELTCWLRALR